MSESKRLSIVDFYAGKSVFITGGTGFLGKVLIEKLLYSCKDIETIYVLIRQNKDKDVEERVKDLIQTPVFERVKNSDPNALNKIIPIRGDIGESNLGINDVDEQSFLDKVSVVFHSAATVKFNEPLDVAVNLNYEATKRVLNMCQRMRNLKSLVYISTAYINPQNDELDEVLYPSPVTDTALYSFLQIKDNYNDESKLHKFLQGRPNTYTITKAIAEAYVAKNHGNIPTAIIRPSVVCSSYHDPVPGWIDSWSAATAVVATTFLGHNHIIIGKKTNKLDFVPVDYATNLCIAGAVKASSSKNLEIFNACTSVSNPLTLKELFKNVVQVTLKNKYNESPIFIIMTDNKKFEKLLVLILDKMPSYMADSWMKIRGKKPRYMKRQARVGDQREFVKYFTARSWKLSAKRTEELANQITDTDAKQFQFNPRTINWPRYLNAYTAGVVKYLLRK